ncbi:MAG: response regulator [Ignavibacteriales bacterium]|nr:response regulator [Ignavibacteriales bacterium]
MDGRLKILVVDDEELAQDFLHFFLSKKFDVYTVGSVNSFYKILNEVDFDLIIMDVSLRDTKDGIQLTKELKQSEKYKGIPIYILTALNTTKERENAQNAGANDFLVKPFESRYLMKLIESSLITST